MLKVNMAELRRRGTFLLDEEIPPDAGLWEGSDLRFGSALVARFEVAFTGGGQVLAAGHLAGRLRQACRRCLTEVAVEFDQDVQFVFAPRDQLALDDDAIREIPTGVVDLDLSQAVREEVILAAPLYAVCREGCRGLCPHCGADRNEIDCECTLEELDPRWDALRGLTQE